MAQPRQVDASEVRELGRLALIRTIKAHRLRPHIQAGFEVTRNRADRIRRTEVYAFVAERMGWTVPAPNASGYDEGAYPDRRRLVAQAIEELGAVAIVKGNARFWRGVRRK